MLGASWLYGDQGRNVFCAADGVTSASWESNAACAIQGVGIIWASTATGCWCVATILNLHMQIVWSSDFMARHRWLLHLTSWGIPTIIAGFATDLEAVEYDSRGICTVNGQYEAYLVFVPLGIISAVIWFLHSCTTLWVWRQTCLRNLSWQTFTWSSLKDMGSAFARGPRADVAVVEDEEGVVQGGGKDEMRPTSQFSDPLSTTSSATTLNNILAIPTEPPTPRTKDGSELEGVRAVQRRLIMFAGVIMSFLVMYAVFYHEDVSRIQSSLQEAPFNATAPSFYPQFAANPTTPLEDLVVCVHNMGALASGAPAVYETCTRALADAGRLSLPEMWRRVLAELTISIAGICLLAVLGWRLVPDWRDYWADRKERQYRAARNRGQIGALLPPISTLRLPRRSTASASARSAGGLTTAGNNSASAGGGIIIPPPLELATFKISPGSNFHTLSSMSLSPASKSSPSFGRPPPAASVRSRSGSGNSSNLVANYLRRTPPSPGAGHLGGGISPPLPVRVTALGGGGGGTLASDSASLSSNAPSVNLPPFSLGACESIHTLSKSVSEREAFGPQFRPW
ncbi:hypothetical protein HDU87_008481 [Geranomyces variabilis]|uniref:G-protein coupled receptors family 2 profile 2 domain-containing protein n=1 Tax=Geranomyces variabilis TaxID=109894 RepID=A0AAD5TQU8_9FUNG|nr:hypothetical protein HDU87_008481 [Geranomyces variabilis]